MPDISTTWTPGDSRGDWALAGADLAGGTDLETAVLISLFTDRKADADDVIPDGSTDPRGWWGDIGRDVPLGSKLWLLERAKKSEETRLRARDYIDEALAWLVERGVALAVNTVVSWQADRDNQGFLGAQIEIAEPDGRRQVFNYQWAWKGVS